MSLKGFHILFITVSTLLCVGLAFWGTHHFLGWGNGTHLTLALLGAAGSLGLPVYGWWFLKKTRDVEML